MTMTSEIAVLRIERDLKQLVESFKLKFAQMVGRLAEGLVEGGVHPGFSG